MYMQAPYKLMDRKMAQRQARAQLKNMSSFIAEMPPTVKSFMQHRSSLQRAEESQERLSVKERGAHARSRSNLSHTNISIDKTIDAYAPQTLSPKRASSPKLTPIEYLLRENKKKQSVKEQFGYLNQVMSKFDQDAQLHSKTERSKPPPLCKKLLNET